MRSRFLAVAASTILALGLASAVSAFFGENGSVPGNTFTLDVLNAPTGPSATTGASITLNWTATVDTYATGHRVFRSSTSGGPYTQIAEVTPRTTTTYIDSPPPGTYYYVIRAYRQNWESINSSQVSAGATITTAYGNCATNAPVTAGSGDNNGFQVSAANACADDGAFAEDTNSGTNTNVNCANAGKDRHLFYDYGFSLPGGATINGIEVRLDAWADLTTGNPRLCAELSWNGGTTWTAAKQTAVLTTAQATYTLGASNDTWGRTWASTEFGNSTLRIRITSTASNLNRDHRLDWVAIRVTYTP